MKKFVSLLLALMMALGMTALAEESKDQLARIQEKGEIVIATEGTWAPWTYTDENGTLVGFDVEIATAIAEKLGVTKPSVVRIMNLLMERGMIVKEHYGKIYMTDRGIFVAKEVRAQLERVLQNFPPVNIELTEEERFAAALALTSALPERAFVGEYERLFGTVSDEAAEPEKAG